MASRLFYWRYLQLFLVFSLWLLCLSVQADHDQRKAYIIYMGTKIKPYAPAKTSHLSMLADVIDSALEHGKASKHLLYTYNSFHGCVANLTTKEAEKISGLDGVVSVFPNRKKHRQTTRSWDFMGLSLDVKRSNSESDVIVGVIDYGIWPESESFSDEGFGPPPAKWKGKCQTSVADNFTCNNKIIGARYFRSDRTFSEADIQSPRDSDGHGTHTASTVAGGVVNMASFLGLGSGTARGGVPSARLAIYKPCWSDGCWGADILAAFDAAIEDGVDILSVSLGWDSIYQYFEDAMAIGSFHAMKKGILTSISAGNDGPGLRTITSFDPWSLTVAASSTDRKFVTKVLLGNGLVLEGISLNTFDLQNKTFPLIHGLDAQDTTSFNVSSGYCLQDSLNRTLVKGKIVVCDTLVSGSEPFLAGAAGMIMQDLNDHDIPYAFPLPASYLSVNDGSRVVSYIRDLTSTPFGTIQKSSKIEDKSAPMVASFSSRGPNPISPGILKPDLTGPGVSILAAWPPTAAVTEVYGDERSVSYNIASGTSMACPHASAVAAYVKSFHPTWSPAAIKSALMTTAKSMSRTVNTEAEFAYGSGHIDPLKAIDPGLVYDMNEGDYVKFLCKEGVSGVSLRIITGDNSTCRGQSEFDDWDLNYPSFALSTTAGTFDVMFRRTVTNVGSSNSTYKAMISVPKEQKIDVKVQPSIISFNRVGQKVSFTVRVTGTIGLRALISASVVWDDGLHQVRSPIVAYNLS